MAMIAPPKNKKNIKNTVTKTDRPAKPTGKKPIQFMIDKNLHTEFKQLALDEDCTMVDLFKKMYDNYQKKR